MIKYLTVIFISMLPLIELRGAVPVAIGQGIDPMVALTICTVANMVPVPIIYFFARKFLLWGSKQKHIGNFCAFFVEKGEKAGQKLVKKTGRGGLFFALLLFVGIPVPGTGAWTGTLAASFLDMGFKSTVASVSLGVLLAGIIMGTASLAVFGIF